MECWKSKIRQPRLFDLWQGLPWLHYSIAKVIIICRRDTPCMKWSQFMVTCCSHENSLHKTILTFAESDAPLTQLASVRSDFSVLCLSTLHLGPNLKHVGLLGCSVKARPAHSTSTLYLHLPFQFTQGFSHATLSCFPGVFSFSLFTCVALVLSSLHLPVALGPSQKFSLPEFAWSPVLVSSRQAFVGPPFTTYLLHYLFICCLLKFAYTENVKCVSFPVLL